MSSTQEINVIRNEPHKFPWGKVINIHDIGSRYSIVEYYERKLISREITKTISFFVYVDGRSISASASSLDEALILAIAHARVGINDSMYATRFIMRLLTP